MQACEASLKRLGRRRHRPLLPASCRSRACRSRRRSARWPSWSSRARFATSACPRLAGRPSGGRTRCIRSRRCRPSTRCSTATEAEETRETTRGLGHRLRRLFAARPRLPDRRDPDLRRRRRAARRASALPGGRTSPATASWSRKIEAMAQEKGCTPAQLTLAWLLAQGPDVVAIPGTRYSSGWTRISARCG